MTRNIDRSEAGTLSAGPKRSRPPVRQNEVVKYFGRLASQYGDAPRGVGWSETSQRRRFEVLTAIGCLSGRTLLDVGCGSGHLLDYLDERGIRCNYTGIDITPRQIHLARKRRPDSWERFHVADIFTASLPTADYVIANGVINTRRSNPPTLMRELLRVLFEHCRVGAALTATSTCADTYDKGVHYFDPVVTIREAMRWTRCVRLDQTYLPHDFAVFYYRDPALVNGVG